MYHGLPRGLYRLRCRGAAATSRSSAGSRREKRLDRAIEIARRAGHAAEDRGQDRRERSRLLRRTRSSRCSRASAGRVRRRDRRAPEGRVPGRRGGAAVPDRLARAVRPGDDRGDGVRHAGGRVSLRLGARGDATTACPGSSSTRRRGGGRRRRAPSSCRARRAARTSRSASRRHGWRADYLAIYRRDGGRAPRPRRCERASGWRDRRRCRSDDGTRSMGRAASGHGWSDSDADVRNGGGRRGRSHEQFYILATSSRADDRTRVLKHGETFAVFDRFGDVQPVGLGEQGLYHDGTRFLSRLELRVGRPPAAAAVARRCKKDNDLLTVDLTNPDLHGPRPAQLVLPRGHAARVPHQVPVAGLLLRAAARLELRARAAVDVELALQLRRRLRRHLRGARHRSASAAASTTMPVVDGASVVLGYEGLDGVVRRTRLRVRSRPRRADRRARPLPRCALPPRRHVDHLLSSLSCDERRRLRRAADYDRRLQRRWRTCDRVRPAVALPRCARRERPVRRLDRPLASPICR